MHSQKTRRAARITAAAVGGVLAAALAIPAGASATIYKAYDNGVLAYSTQSGAVHTIFQNGTNDATVATLGDPLGVQGVAAEWSADGNRLLLTDASKNLLDVNPWTKAQIATVDEPYDIVGPSMSPDGTAYAFGSPTDGVNIYTTGDQATHQLLGGSSDGTAWSNQDQLTIAFDGNGVYRFTQPLDYLGGNIPGNWASTDEPNPKHVTTSRDGLKVAFTAHGTTDDVFVSPGDGASSAVNPEGTTNSSNERLATISPDGKKVAFVSDRANDGTWSIYIRDLIANTTTKVANSTQAPGVPFTGLSWQPAMVPHLAQGEISSATEVGSTLTLDPMYDEPTAPVTTTWQWQRCTNVVNAWTGTCVDLPGETNAGYHLTSADVGNQYRVVRTVTNGAGTDTDASEITEAVVEPDTTAPGVPTITTKPGSRSKVTAPAFAWTGAEAGGTFQCSIDNAAFAACTSGSTFAITGEGSHRFRVRQTDASNNAGDPAEYTWTLDTTAPAAPTVTTQPSAVTASTSATIAFTGAEAGGSFECRLGAGSWVACASPLSLTGLTEGNKQMSIRQVDAAGNTGTAADVTWAVDLTAPVAPVFTQDQDDVHAFTTQYAFTGENGATFECRLDTATWATCASPVTLSSYATGAHTFEVRQTDAAGHVSPVASDAFTAHLDGPAAPALGNGIPALRSTQATAAFAFTGTAASYECRLDTGAWAACTTPATFTNLAEGQHTFRIRGLDAYNITGAETTYTWTVDTVAPAMPTLTNGPAAQTTSTSIEVQVGGLENDATTECDLDGQGWSACAVPVRRDGLGLGQHTLKVRQKDAAGNAGQFASLTWTVIAAPTPEPTPTSDATPPATPNPTTPTASKTPETAPTTTPSTTTPGTTTPTVSKPKLNAILGGGTGSTGSGTSSAAAITVREDGVGVGCSITGTVLTACRVDLYAVDTTAGTATASAAASKQVLVGTGTYRKADGSKQLQVEVTLNATGRALMRKSPQGLKVSVKITGTPVKGEKLQATGVATLVRQRVSATVGGFATNSAKLTPAAQRQLAKLAKQVKGTAVALRVVGHTDASSDDAGYLDDLGLRRAKAVAAYLRSHGVKAKATLASRGARKPKATNATAAGRAENRRVELRIDR